MNPQNKKAIDNENSSSSKSQNKRDNLRQRKNNNEAKSSESYEQTNISESNAAPKRKKQFHGVENDNSESKEDERENRFLGKKRKTKTIENKDDKEREKNARPKKNNDEIQKNKTRKNITYLTISDSESEDESIIPITESINEERKKRTIYARVLAKQKINESDISQIFDKYGEISKIQLKSDYSCLVEFANKNSVDKIMVNKNKIIFKGKGLLIENSMNQINEISVKKNKQASKYEAQDPPKIRKVDFPEKKEEKNEKFLNVQTKEENFGAKDNFSLEEKVKQLTNELNLFKKENEKKIHELEVENAKRIQELEKEKAERIHEIDNLKISLNIMAQINDQRDILYKNNMNYINNNMRLLLNSYKMLYMRKLANLILEQIYLKYSDDLGNGRVQVGKTKHNIIALHPNSREKYKRDYYQINLIIDFLKFIWDKCSDVIHLQDKNFPLVKELFYEYLKPLESSSNNGKVDVTKSIDINDLIEIIFSEREDKKPKRGQSQTRDNNLENAIKKLLQRKKKNKTTDKNKNEDTLIIQITESDDVKELDVQYDENEIKEVVKDNLKEYDLNNEIKKLIQLIEKNSAKKNLLDNNGIEINSKYFYSEWLNTFSKEKYKQKKYYMQYFKKDKIIGLKEMGLFVCGILKNQKLRMFINDPQGVNKNIENKLP